jgi:hypothetical protein
VRCGEFQLSLNDGLSEFGTTMCSARSAKGQPCHIVALTFPSHFDTANLELTTAYEASAWLFLSPRLSRTQSALII